MTSFADPITQAKRQLPGYTFVEFLYQGNRTTVYRAIATATQQPVVIKVLSQDYPSFSELVQFRNQYTIAKRLTIAGIVHPLSLEPCGNGYGLVMEDFGGISLAHYARQHPLSLTEILNIAIQLAAILHDLHQHRVIHKDIKPANILIHPESKQIKLIDFSLASLLPKETQVIQSPKSLEGTLAYLAPEQTGRMNRAIDYRTDFYALGVTLYQLLTGQIPFTSDDPMELIHCHIAKMPVPPCELVRAEGAEESVKVDVNRFIPKALSAIVLKLMAKNAEDRYQSALGLKYDLEHCLTQWQEKGEIAEFVLGQRDLSDRFLISENLYGRENEVRTLLESFDRVTQRGAELMLVAGFSGIGKTALVNEVHKPIVRQRGYFIKGKFEQFNRNIPFSAFVQAFRSLMGQLLGESDAALANWKAKILTAVGKSGGQVLIEVIPELEHIIGKQLTAPELSGSAAQKRFNLLFGKFVQVFATQDHPLVIFLDDLQWADLASLSLLKSLLMESQIDSENKHLLILGAYRDNEVFSAHPLMLTLDEVAAQETKINTLNLAPLSESDINQLVADTLLCSTDIAKPISQLIYQKTRGNPFFSTQFLQGLHQSGYIVFDTESGFWQCDLARVKQAALTDDVVQFIVGRLQTLAPKAQDVLKMAACIGNQFDLATLAVVCEQSQEDVAADLWQALQEGLVIPESASYKFFQGENLDIRTAKDITISYRFLHDRVQQASYALIPDAQMQITHLRIGRLLLNKVNVEEQSDQLFKIVNQLNIGFRLIEDRSERIELAKLNLIAAQKAKKSTAYSAAVEYLESGIKLLESKDWIHEYELQFKLHKEYSESEYLKGDIVRSEKLAHQTLEKAKFTLDKVAIYNILIVQYTVTSRYQDAISKGKVALELLGIKWNEDHLKQNLEDELKVVKESLGSRDIASLIHLPEIESPEKKSAISVLHHLLPVAFSFNLELWRVLVVKMVSLALKYGHTAECCFGYSFYGVFVSSTFDDYEAGYQFGMLSLKLSQKFNDLAQQSKACNILAAFLLHWKKHVRNCESINNHGYVAGLESGQLQFVGYIIYNKILSIFHSGKNLSDLSQEFAVYLPILENIKHYYSYDITVGIQLAISRLMEPTHQKLKDQVWDAEEERHLATCQSRKSLPAICIYQILKAQNLYIFERPQAALKCLASAHENLDFIGGHFAISTYNYYYSLSLLSCFRNASSEEKKDILDKVQENQKLFRIWAFNSHENFQHKSDLIEAEIARNTQNKLVAIERYDAAIAGAKEHEFLQDEALANELAAKFYFDWRKEKIAAGYMQEAYYGYSRWGAKAKVADLEARYPELLQPILQQTTTSVDVLHTLTTIVAPTALEHSSTRYSSDSTNLNQTFDFVSILQASQALSSTIQLDELLRQLTQIILQNSGGDRCALILPDETGEWQIRAIATPEETQLYIEPLTNNPNLPVKLIQYVKNTQRVILIEDLETDLPVIDDYLKQHQPRSVLCLPLLNQGHLIAILYLRNQLTSGIFTSDRILILNFLCTQAAISLKNAHLYQQVQQALTELQQAQLQLVQSEKMSALGGLVAGVAHEINNPVGCVIGNVHATMDYINDLLGLIDLYTKQFPDPGPEIAEELEAIDLDYVRADLPQLIHAMKDSGERIKSISKSLGIFSRADTKTKQAFNLHEGIESTVLILRHRLKANEFRPAIEVITDYGNIPDINCFPGQLNQVFMNLLANAIDALDEASQIRSLNDIKAHPQRITIRTEVDSQQVKITIADNGPGIPETLTSQVFDYLFTTKSVGKGTGLGLAIARQIVVDNHDGDLDVQSQVGQGTEFCIRLPL